MTDLVFNWWQKQQQLSVLKDEEMALRKQVVEQHFADAKVGTNKHELGGGYLLKAAIKEIYSIPKSEATGDYTHVAAVLEKLPPGVAHDLVVWKPELSVTAYKNLTAEERAIVNEFVLIKPGAPSLEVVEPKPKKGA